MENGEHGPGCHLKPGNHWRDCCCAELDVVDRPCIACQGLEHGAETCASCRKIHEERAAARATLPDAIPGKELDKP